MSASAQMRRVALTWADRKLLEQIAPVIAGFMASLSAEELLELIRQGKDMDFAVPDGGQAPQEVGGVKRAVARARLGAAPQTGLADAVRDAVHASLLQAGYKRHAALLNAPQGRAWYAANAERLRMRLLREIGGG